MITKLVWLLIQIKRRGSINKNESVTNGFGLAAISNVPTYYRSTQYVDLNNVPDNVSIDDSVIESNLTHGAVGYSKLNTLVGKKR
ncbi:fimbria/pilus outer membrane usher protein [Providencia hangzhouensis]